MWSPTWFPVVGAMIGCLLAATASVAGPGSFALPSGVVAWVVTAMWVMLTGGLHLDGLMDTADGLLSGRPAPQALEIMRDSRVGGMGVLAAILLLIGKWTFVSTLATGGGGGIASLVLIPLWARWGGALAMQLFPYARTRGMASGYFEAAQRSRWTTVAGASAMAVVGTAFPVIFGRLSPGLVASPFIVSATVTLFLGHRWTARFGGLTGDLYGAIIELNELLALLLTVVVLI